MGKRETFTNTLNNWLSSKLFQVHTILPGKIVTYYGHAERKAKVQPLVNPRDWQNDTISLQPIDDVPIIFQSTSNFNMQFPLQAGDGVLLLFSENSLGEFLNSNTGQQVDADDINRFDMTDCIAIPGLYGFRNIPYTPENDDDMVISFVNSLIKITKNTGEITITTGSGEIKIEQTGDVTINNGAEPFILGNQFQTNWNTLNTAIQALTPGTTAQNAVAIAGIQAAFNAFTSTFSTMLSALIKGQ